MKPIELLQHYWGYPSFRPQQQEIINSILDGHDTLALLPTGGGKSLCYQIPALAKDGFCLVVSPLIALMQDQVQRLTAQGIAAACIYAGLARQEVINTLENTARGSYKLLYISPERLQTRLFQEYLPSFNINLIAVDEAHCISQWGHDFRPEYLKIATLKKLFYHTPFLALTASATKEVEADIAMQLRLYKPHTFRQSFCRANIFYRVLYAENKWAALLESLQQHESDCCIVYCRSRRQTEALMKQLREQGYNALNYHAGMTGANREQHFAAWLNGDAKIMVATTAFGMGIDKADVRLVLHYDAPEHIEAYYQEAGRAGRDGLPCEALLLYNSGDLKRLHETANIQFPPEAFLRQTYQAVCEYLQLPIGAQPNHYFDFELTNFCKKFSLPILPATHALRLLAQEGLWSFTDDVFHQATIIFTVERSAIDEINNLYPNLGIVCISLLRLYGHIAYHPTAVKLQSIARQAKMKDTETEQCLLQLQGMGVLEYQKPKDGPQLFFQHQRADSRYLIIDHKRIEKLRQRHIKRTEAMVNFLRAKGACLEKMILHYFGEEASATNCGHCETCLQKALPILTEQEITTIINEQLAANGMTAQQLLKCFPANQKDTIIICLRQLMDSGKIIRNEEGVLIARLGKK